MRFIYLGGTERGLQASHSYKWKVFLVYPGPAQVSSFRRGGMRSGVD